MPALPRAGAWLALALLLTLAWFAGLGTRALWHPDEGRYAEIAREMAQTGDWVTPRLTGLEYFEKPPLQYWLTAAAYSAFGVHEWTARIVPALFGWLAVAAVGYAGLRLEVAGSGTIAAIALAASAWPIGLAHFVSLDAVLTGCLAVGLAAFLVAQSPRAAGAASQRWMMLAWAAIAGAVLAKGLVGLVIPGGALVVYSLLTRDFGPWRRLALVPGLAVLVALAAPWFVLVSARNPEFARFFFVHEHFERFLTTEHNRGGAWWYFVPLLLAGLLPWTGLFLARLPQLWRAPAAANAFSWQRFCLAWCAFVFVFFSLSGSKLPSYILPLFPAAALLVGAALSALPMPRLARLLGASALLAVALALATVSGWDAVAHRVATARTPVALYGALGTGVKLGFAALAVLALAAWRIARRGERGRVPALGLVALGMIAVLALGFYANDALSPSRSTRDLVAALTADRAHPYDASAPFYQIGLYDQTLPWYLRRTTTVVDYRDELALGLDLEPAKGIASMDDWRAQWRALPQGYALLDPDTFARLARDGLPLRVAARSPRYVIAARR